MSRIKNTKRGSTELLVKVALCVILLSTAATALYDFVGTHLNGQAPTSLEQVVRAALTVFFVVTVYAALRGGNFRLAIAMVWGSLLGPCLYATIVPAKQIPGFLGFL